MCNLNIPLRSVSIGFVDFTCSVSCFWNYIATFSTLIIRTGNIKYFSIFVIKALQGPAIAWGIRRLHSATFQKKRQNLRLMVSKVIILQLQHHLDSPVVIYINPKLWISKLSIKKTFFLEKVSKRKSYLYYKIHGLLHLHGLTLRILKKKNSRPDF